MLQQINNFEIVDTIGSGAYGIVYKVKDLLSDNFFAMKVISTTPHTDKLVKKSDTLQETLSFCPQVIHPNCIPLASVARLTDKDLEEYPYYRELALQLRVHSHPNVLTIHQILSHVELLFVVMNFYGDGDLFGNIVDKQVFAECGSLIKKVFSQICSVLEFCHSKHVYHNDIKPENILYDSTSQKIALADFGLATTCDQNRGNVHIGSSYYMPPERLSSKCGTHFYSSAKSDAWSLGIILINLTCIRNPWLQASFSDSTFRYYKQDTDVLLKILPITRELNSIITQVLQVDVDKRVSLSDLKKMVLDCKTFLTEGPLSHVDDSLCDLDSEEDEEEAYNTFSLVNSVETTPSHSVDESYDDKLNTVSLRLEESLSTITNYSRFGYGYF